MELAHLRALRELRDRGSIAAVAAALGVTPSSVSQQLSALQRTAGVPLTRIDGRRRVLTDAGLALAAATVDIESAYVRAESALADFRDDTSTVTVSAFHSAAIALFPALLAAGHRVTVADADVATDAFPALTTSHDLVVAHRMVGSRPWPTTVAAVPLLAEPLDLAFRAGHRLDGLARVRPTDLVDESWIAVHEGFPLDDAVRRVTGAAGHDPHIAHRVNDFQVVAALLRVTDHVALMPRWTSRVYAGADLRLTPIVGDFGLVRRIDVLARPETLERTGVRTVLRELRRAARALRGDGDHGPGRSRRPRAGSD